MDPSPVGGPQQSATEIPPCRRDKHRDRQFKPHVFNLRFILYGEMAGVILLLVVAVAEKSFHEMGMNGWQLTVLMSSAK